MRLTLDAPFLLSPRLKDRGLSFEELLAIQIPSTNPPVTGSKPAPNIMNVNRRRAMVRPPAVIQCVVLVRLNGGAYGEDCVGYAGAAHLGLLDGRYSLTLRGRGGRHCYEIKWLRTAWKVSGGEPPNRAAVLEDQEDLAKHPVRDPGSRL
jgi:hypothetical protein